MARHNCWLIVLLEAHLLLASVVHGVSVAPNDASQHCLDSVTRQSVPDGQKIVLDSQDYLEQSLLNTNGDNGIWNSENYDGIVDNSANYKWVDQAQTVICAHQLLACDPDNAGQNNWLVTQYINITDDGVDELIINMEFSTSNDIMECPTCQQSFSVYSYETNVIDETGRRNESFFTDTGARFFHTQNNAKQQSDQKRIPLSSKGLYLSVVDSGSCTRILRIYVFYYVCQQQVLNMIEYPETVSPPNANPQDRPAIGTCIENASPVSGNSLALECNVNGIWGNTDLSCSCNSGYEIIVDTCEPCDEGRYKLTQGNEECIECPDNSNSTSPGAESCECISGYYRANNENSTVKCTAPPSAPLNLASTIDSTFITISWLPPVDNGERNDTSYLVTYNNGSYTSPALNIDNVLQYTITGLIPSTQYTISVISVNGVSDQDSNTANRTITITVTTENRGPSSPTGIDLSDSLILQWNQPDYLYGTLLYYNILIASTDNASLATVHTNTSGSTFDLSTLNIPQGTYYVWVQAVTNNGIGELSQSVPHTVFDTATTDNSSNTIIAAAASGVVVLLMIIVIVIALIVIIILIVNYRSKRERYVPTASNHSNNGEIELGSLPLTDEDSSNRMYVDPRNYSSLNQAFDESGVKEIPPKEISNLEEIGLGEFGLVYKGIWALKNVKVAVKTLKGGATDEQKRNFLFEASVMGQFRHPNVVKLYGIISRVDPIMIIMEYLDSGSLDRYLQKHLDKLGLMRQLKIAYGAAVGMSYLSKIGFVHRDLAARNILMTKEEKPKVADFGLAREMVENEYGVQRGGRIPVRWTAPEAISHRSFSTASDVWSFGILLWEIMTYGETPYEGWDNYTVFNRLEEGERLKQPRYCPDDVYQLMLCCWEQERVERPSFDNICEGLEILIDGKPKPKPKPQHLKQISPQAPSPPPRPEVQPIGDLLSTIAMSKYIEAFHQHKLLTVEDCYDLSEDDLERMGITLAGHQYKIIKNIRIKQEEIGTQY